MKRMRVITSSDFININKSFNINLKCGIVDTSYRAYNILTDRDIHYSLINQIIYLPLYA